MYLLLHCICICLGIQDANCGSKFKPLPFTPFPPPCSRRGPPILFIRVIQTYYCEEYFVMLCSRRGPPPTQIPHNCTIQLYICTPDVAHQFSYSAKILHRNTIVVHSKDLQKYKQNISRIQGNICHLELVQCNNM